MIPPQATDLERAVLGAMMLERNAVTDAIDILLPESFYDPRNQVVFEAIRNLFNESKPIDLLTVVEALKATANLEMAGGLTYISQLTSKIGTTAHVEYHARVISEKHIKRELIRMGNEMLKRAFDDSNDVFDVLNKAEEDLFGIAQNNIGKPVDDMQSAVRQAIEEIDLASKNPTGISGVPTGFFELDKITAGWQRSDMIVIAARPAMGKTAFVLSMARNTAIDHGHAVAIFSLEMSSVQLAKRLIASEARLSAEKLRKGDLASHEFQQLHSRISKLATAKIFIDDTPGLSVFDLRAKCRRLKLKHNIDIVIIDYLQLMSAGGNKSQGTREQEISTISRSIKEIAKELNIPIVALSQLSRSVEQRGGDKRPLLSDLRESGAIEQDADIVSFIYRPEYYGFIQDESGQSNAGVGEIIIAKHRNGALENVRLRFVKEFARFENFDDQPSFHEDERKSRNELSASNFDTNSGTLTIPSKLNSLEEDLDLNSSNDETPF